jgi:flagellar assembly protein FliH
MSERPNAQARTVERWLPPKVEGAPLARGRDEHSSHAPASQAEAASYAAGVARAQAESQSLLAVLARQTDRFEAVLRQLVAPVRELDEEVEQALLALAVALGSQLARRALEAEPAQMIALVRECLQALPLGARQVRVHLHPQDAAVVRERLVTPTGERAWSLVEDPTLARGGCLVQSEHSQLDARFESRLNGLIAAALGDARGPARAPARSATDEQGAT